MTRLHRLIALPLLLGASAASAAVGVGDRPPLDARLLDGAALSGAEFAGHPVVLAFWAAAHPASVEAIEALAAKPEAAEAGAVFLGVALDADAAAARSTAGAVAGGPGWEHVVNAEQPETLDTRFYDAPYGIPAVWLLDAEGAVAWSGHPDDLAGPLDELLAATPAAPAWTASLRDRRVGWTGALAATDLLVEEPEGLLAAAQGLLGLGALEPEAATDPVAAEAAATIVDRVAALPGMGRAKLEMARDAAPEGAQALDRLLAVAGEDANASAAARAARVERVEAAERAAERGDDAAAVSIYAELFDGGPPDAPEVRIAGIRLEEFRARGVDAEAAKAEADAAEAERMLQMARMLGRGYQEEKAIELIDELLERFPGTPSAAEATQLRSELE